MNAPRSTQVSRKIKIHSFEMRDAGREKSGDMVGGRTLCPRACGSHNKNDAPGWGVGISPRVEQLSGVVSLLLWDVFVLLVSI